MPDESDRGPCLYRSNIITKTPSTQKTALTINGSYFSSNLKRSRCSPSNVNHVNVIMPAIVAIARTALNNKKPTQPYRAPVKNTGRNASQGEKVRSAIKLKIAAQSDRCLD